jgi:two-component system, OmpR family, sensor kinase
VKAGSLRLRVTLATLAALAVVLTAVVTAATLLYRSSLQRDLRRQLDNAATAFEQSWPAAPKQLIASLALEGIATDLHPGPEPLPPGKAGGPPPPTKVGRTVSARGSLLVLTDVLPDGTWVTFSSSRARIGHSVVRLLLFELLAAFIALGAAALLLRRITATTLRPLTDIAETASRIASGETSRLDPERADTELGRLATAFDLMVDSLEATAARAQRSEAAMRRFLADASHELRTPVAALQASAETLLREQPERPERDRMEAQLSREAARLGRLVDDLLSLARVEGRRPDAEVVDLAVAADAAVAESRVEAPGAEVTTDLEPRTQVSGDAPAMTRALRNLVENACTAAGRGGHVRVTVLAAGGDAVARVVDDGPGIPEYERERIFERFVRLAPDGRPGSGLGLAIAREIARRHGGDITCDPSEGGASFTLRLPLAGRASSSSGE